MSDLRTIRTYKLLKGALLELLSKNSFDSIKVNDICDLAMVHRTTFYSHFSDKYELLDYVIHDIEKEILSDFSTSQFNSTKEFYSNLIMSLLNYIGSNKVFYRNMMKNNYSAGIITIFHNSAITHISEIIEKEQKNNLQVDVPITVMSEFYSGAVTATLMWWLNSNTDISEEQLCNYIISLIFDKHDWFFVFLYAIISIYLLERVDNNYV